MTQQLQHQSAQPSEDSSQPTAPLWYEQTQVPTQYPAYSPAFPQAPAEPRFAAFTQPGATPRRMDEWVANTRSHEPSGGPTQTQGRTIMSAIMQETTAPSTIVVTTGEAQPEFSQEYSKGELEEMGSRELLAGYAA